MYKSIELTNYNYKDILNINLEIKKNTFNLILGKDDLLNAFGNPYNALKYGNGILKINSIELKKNNVKSISKKIGYVPNELVFIKDNVVDELLFPLLNLGKNLRNSKKIVYAISKKIGIDDLITKKIDELSESQKVLVYITSILTYNPEIIVIQNTLEALDNKTRTKLLKLLKEMDSTIIFYSNNPEDILIADSIIISDFSNIVCKYTLENILENEKILYEINLKLPFMVELSKKLIIYKIIDKIILNEEEMIDKIWK